MEIKFQDGPIPTTGRALNISAGTVSQIVRGLGRFHRRAEK